MAKKSKVEKISEEDLVNEFLDDIRSFDLEKFEILEKLRKIVFRHYPKASEKMMYGGIMFTMRDDFGGLFVRKNHISFEFSDGVQFKDPGGHLEGTGQSRRHLKLRSIADIKSKQVDFFVKQVDAV